MKLIWLGLLLLSSTVRAADFAFTPTLQQAYTDILKLNVSTGRQALSGELARRNGVAVYLDNYADMVTLLVTDDRQLFDRFSPRQDQRLDLLQDMDENSPWQRFAQAEIRLQWAFVKLKFGEEVSACWDIIRSYKLLEENRRRFPGFVPNEKSLGVLHILIGSVPENYTWVARLLGLRGSVREGMRELQNVVQKDPLYRTEARLFDLLARAFILKFTPADAEQVKRLVAENPDNLTLHFFGARMLMKDGRSEEALQILQRQPAGPSYMPLAFLDYMKGEIAIQKGAYPQALTYYKAFLNRYKGRNFLKDTYYKQFLCYWLSNDDQRAAPLIRQVMQTGATVVEADKAAQKFAETYSRKGYSANQKIIMKARLATDGGYLDSALNALRPYSEASFTLPAEKAEFMYRKGRIFQRRGEIDAAIPLYERAIALSQTSQLAYGATSALQLGYIFQQKRNPALARQYFKKALSYKKHEYKNSIDNKAKAALNELGE